LHEGAQPHWELVKKYDIIDFELGVKITGAGSLFIKEKAPNCNALINYFLDKIRQVTMKYKYHTW
jgi:seryl-tRNA synthetase